MSPSPPDVSQTTIKPLVSSLDWTFLFKIITDPSPSCHSSQINSGKNCGFAALNEGHSATSGQWQAFHPGVAWFKRSIQHHRPWHPKRQAPWLAYQVVPWIGSPSTSPTDRLWSWLVSVFLPLLSSFFLILFSLYMIPLDQTISRYDGISYHCYVDGVTYLKPDNLNNLSTLQNCWYSELDGL